MTYSWDQRVEDYRTYLSRRSVLDEQLKGVQGAASEICSGVSAQTRDLLGSMDSMTSALSADIGALSAGIESGLGHVAGVLEDGFAGLLRKSDEIKQELQRLVELVELEEQRKAMENFRYAVFALNRGLWDEALEYVTAAIEGDVHSKGYKLDWHFHWVKGELLLGSPARHDWPGVDPAEAEQAFLLSSRYARADVPKEAAKSLLMASVAAYAQSHGSPAKLEDMRLHADNAFALDRSLAEAAFQLAKAQMALGAPDAALPALRKAIDTDVRFAIRAAEDPDHRRHEARLNGFFSALRDEKARDVTERARAVYGGLQPLAAKSDDFASYPAVRQIREVASGGATGWPLIALLEYGATGLEAANQAAERESALRRASLSVEKRVTTRRWEERIEVDEPFEDEETYYEDVVVKPGGWFKKPVVESVARTRLVKRTRKVQKTVERTREQEQLVVLDGFGDVVRSARAGGLVRVPAGEFAREGRRVRLTRPFLIGMAPVTQGEYEALLGVNPSKFKGAEHPVEQVSWNDAVRFCNALSRASGLDEAYVVDGDTVRWKGLDCAGYRLPTEAEWEYACRAGTTGERYGELDSIAWYSENSGKTTHPVGQKQPNAWGLYDTLGNVWEWCWDWHGDLPKADASDPLGPSGGSDRVPRGGSWYSVADDARAAYRHYWCPGYRYDHLGFRLARSAP